MKQIALVMGIILALFAQTALAAAGPEFNSLPDQTVEMNAYSQTYILDLRDYVSNISTSPDNLSYIVSSQSNSQLIDCFIENNYYISCSAPTEDQRGISTVTVSATDNTGLTGSGTFSVLVTQNNTNLNYVSFNTEPKNLTLEPGQSGDVRSSLTNSTDKYQCITLRAILSTGARTEITATVPDGQICLGANETLEFTVEIFARKDARAGNYSVDLQASVGNSSVTDRIRVQVSDQSERIGITRLGNYFTCIEPYSQDITLKITNNTGSQQEIELSADNSTLMPEFDVESIILRASRSEEIPLTLHTTPNMHEGEYTINVTANTGQYNVRRQVKVNLTQCEEKNLKAESDVETLDVQKGGSEVFTITVFNDSDEEQLVWVSSDGDIENNLNATQLTLPAHGDAKVELTVKASLDEVKGSHIITFYAWNANDTVTLHLRANVTGRHKLEVAVANNTYSQRNASATKLQEYSVTVKNTGDYTESTRFSVRNDDDTILTTLTKTSASIESGFEEHFNLVVQPTNKTKRGQHTLTLRVQSAAARVDTQIYFTVVEPTKVLNNAALEFLTYPQQTQIAPGAEKELTFVVRNNLSEAQTNVLISLKSGESGIRMTSVTISSLAPGESRQVSAKLSALATLAPGSYNVGFEARGNETFNYTQATIRVGTADQNDSNSANPFAGLFVLDSGSATTVLALMIIGAVLLIVFSAYNAIYKGEGEEPSTNTSGDGTYLIK